jgi:hypothetical protein
VSILGGRVQLYSAQSPAFLNSQHNPSAVTAMFTGVSNPLGMSINNALGRLWPVNAPADLDGIGTSTICDPDGGPLAGAPNPQDSGVFAGALTPRQPAQLLAGALHTGAVGTAFLGRSPDGSGRAVFSVVLADGSLVQAHTLRAVHGLAPASAVSPLLGHRWHGGGDDTSPRLGVLLNYEPTRLLNVSEPFENSIAVLALVDDGTIFRVSAVHRFHADVLNQPVDLAPAMIETEDPNWASNTTLEEAADFYVANRGDNTIVRMDQEGTVVAVRRVRLGMAKHSATAASTVSPSPRMEARSGSRCWGNWQARGIWRGPCSRCRRLRHSRQQVARVIMSGGSSGSRKSGTSAASGNALDQDMRQLNSSTTPVDGVTG